MAWFRILSSGVSYGKCFRVGRVVVHLNPPLIGAYPDIRHAPQSWPWWKLVHFSQNSLAVHPPSSGRRFWMYTRTRAYDLDITIDRRKL